MDSNKLQDNEIQSSLLHFWNVVLITDKGEFVALLVDVDATGYRQLIGKLLYLTFTRLDISYAVQILSQFMDAPTENHVDAAHRVLKYLKTSPRQGILMSSDSNLKLIAYCDNDWSSCPDIRKFVTR